MNHILLVCLDDHAQPQTLRQALALLGFSGPDPRWRQHGDRLLSVALERALAPDARQQLDQLPGVRRVVAAGELWPPPATRSSVLLGRGARIGAGHCAVIAGPCSVESRAQISEIAAMVREHGATALRGGAFKPRTSPYAFGGLGEAGLEALAEARARTGLPVVTEALDTECLDVVARYADVVQIGSRNMQNFPFLFQAGCHPLGRPVLLKRGLSATLEELLHAAEYVRLGQFAAGHDAPGLILCERGIRTFEPAVRYTLDVAAFPVLRARTSMPLLADPSHAAGRRDYVRPLACAAVAAGADGLLVEVHTDPDRAWSDAAQTLGPAEFAALMREVGDLLAARPRAPGATCARQPVAQP